MPPFRLYIIASLVFFLLVPVVSNTFQGPDPEAVREAIESGADLDQQLSEAVRQGELTPEEEEALRTSLAQLGIGAAPAVGSDAEGANGDAASADPPAGEADDRGEDARSAEALNPDAVADDPLFQLGLDRGDGEERTFEIGGDDGGNVGSGIRRYFTPEDFGEPAPDGAWPYPVRHYFGERFARVAEDPSAWLEKAGAWIPRIMFAMVPLYALLLGLTYAWRRGFFLYDHLIVSVHFHAALFLAMTAFYLASYILPGALLMLGFILYSNIYLYKLHRVVYERGRITSVLRTVALDFVYAVILMFALMSALLLGALAV